MGHGIIAFGEVRVRVHPLDLFLLRQRHGYRLLQFEAPDPLRGLLDEGPIALLALLERRFGGCLRRDILDQSYVSHQAFTVSDLGSIHPGRNNVAIGVGKPVLAAERHLASRRSVPFVEHPLAVVRMDGLAPAGAEGLLLGKSGDALVGRIGVLAIARGIGNENPEGRRLRHGPEAGLARPKRRLCRYLLVQGFAGFGCRGCSFERGFFGARPRWFGHG
jgi:hypothetical protein